MAVKKLIEVALPLEAINEAAAYEKMPGIGAHPRGLHQWWARRPLSTARAVIFASLVDDPSAHPERFPDETAVAAERKRLFDLIEKLVRWENVNNQEVLEAARAEIRKATGGNPPVLLDPFAGGGSIPLEAQRLGLEAIACDLNPVAVLINKAMIEIPPKFAGRPPVHPRATKRLDDGWPGASGLAEDVRRYGEWMTEEAIRRIGHLYPKVTVPGQGEATVIAWLWARTVKCPNPACGCEMPLASSFVLSKKKGKEAWVEPVIETGQNRIRYTVRTGQGTPPDSPQMSRGANFKCLKCGNVATPDHIRGEAVQGRMAAQLMAVVAEGRRGRIYLAPDAEQENAAAVPKPDDYPDGELSPDRRAITCPNYGLTHFAKLFTNRQLTALTTFSALVQEAQQKAEADALAAGLINDGRGLEAGGTGAKAYAEAVGVYLTFILNRLADFSTSVSRWAPTNEKAMNCFNKQAIAMTWDFPEVNILGDSVGSITQITRYIVSCIEMLPIATTSCVSLQQNAQSDNRLRGIVVSTDPPYYDNIGYADLSDFFYVWLRQSLKTVFPDLFRTMLVPKEEELVAVPYRFGGSKEKAKTFFEDGMSAVCRNIHAAARDDIPVTIYYAYKQSDSEAGESQTASTGWETMLSAIMQAGFTITGTWPVRTEGSARMRALGSNALASSIVIVCRKRPESAPVCTRRNFINALKRELRPALQKLQSSNIAPVDLAQSAIGPGMGVYSQYSQVLEADGTPMSVRSALKVINQEIDLYFDGQDNDLDSESRFCVNLYSQVAFNEIKFGDANTLATAKNTSVATMVSHGTLYAQGGIAHLIERPELPESINEHEGGIWLLCQQLAYKMEKEGVEGCAKAVANMIGSNAERAKDLAYRLYTIAERKKWAPEAYAYNALVVAWPEIQSRAAELQAIRPEQMELF